MNDSTSKWMDRLITGSRDESLMNEWIDEQIEGWMNK